jgi:hypothetical protein
LTAAAGVDPIRWTPDWKLVKIGAKLVSHGGYVAFQMAEVAVARELSQEILRLITGIKTRPERRVDFDRCPRTICDCP